MDYLIHLKTNANGEVIDAVGIREVNPQDRLLGITPLPALHPSPEVRQALAELVKEAKNIEAE